jgi:GWxTD domain-containing protein
MTRMKRTPTLLALLLALAVALSAVPAAKPKLSERYKKWLDEEVVYIITSTERDVFQKLTTDRERDLFIEAFWKHRDPTPDSAANEFKTEHYRRIAYASQYLGREAPVPGWRTDRGRIYIILGEPQEKQNFTGKSGVYDCETWFYQGKADQSLPVGFYLLFFKERGIGSYRLYSPSHDGPQALLSGYVGDPTDYVKAYQTLNDIDGNLATISMGLVPGEDSGLMLGRPSASSDLLIQRIETLPSRMVQEKYARKFLEYKDLVEVEYSANYLDCDSLIKVFREPNGLYFVHYSIEPQRLSVNQYERKFYTTLKVNGRVTTLDGRLVYQYDKTASLDMDEAQMAEVSRAPFEYHDVFPLVPGDYKLSILVKNEVSKEFMSIEQAIRIPQGGPAVQMTQPVLGYKVTRVDPARRKIKAFKIGPYEIYCQPGRIFTAGDILAIGFQLNGLSDDLAQNGLVKIAFFKDDKPFREITRKPSEYQDLPNALEQIPLSDFPPAHYKVRVSVLKAGAEVVSAGEEFDLTHAAALARPWFQSRILPAADDPIYDRITGSQLFNLGRYDEALVFHEKAYRARPDSVEAAYGLAQAYTALGRYPQAVQLLSPLLGKTPAPAYEVYVLAGEALRKAGDFARAVEVLDQAVSHYGVNASVLNAIGESYLGLGKRAEALASFEKSLQLSPEQPEVRKKVEELRKRK